MRTRERTLIALLFFCPGAASACSICFDSAVFEWSWWTTGISFLAVGFFLEMVVSGIAARVIRVPISGGARWVAGGIVLGLLMGVLGFGMTGGLAFFFALCMSLRMTRSVREMRKTHPRLALARVGLVLAIVVIGLFSARPGARSTEWLVNRIGHPLHNRNIPGHLVPSTWIEQELVSRPDAPERLLARLAGFEPGATEYSRDRGAILRLLRSHAMADREGRARFAECERLGVTPDWDELLRSMNATVVCGRAAEEVAVAPPPQG